MTQVTIHQAKTNLSKLIQLALSGEEVIIAKRNFPMVRLVALPEARHQRRIGGAKDAIKFIAEDFDAPMADFEAYMQ